MKDNLWASFGQLALKCPADYHRPARVEKMQ